MRDLLRAELEALVDAIEESDPQLLEAAHAIALWARRRSERFGGSPSVTVGDVQTVLALWAEEFPGGPTAADLGFHEETLLRLLGWYTDGDGRKRSIVDAVLSGRARAPAAPLRRGEQAWKYLQPCDAQRVVELVVLLVIAGQNCAEYMSITAVH